MVWFVAVAIAAPIEAWQGGELGDARMVGMGGAYLAVADTGGATLENPASLAIRRPLRADLPTQLDGSLVATGLNLSARPFQPTGLGGPRPNLLAQAGGVLKLGPWGIGVHGVRFGYAWDPDLDDSAYDRLQHGLVAVGLARAFGGGQAVVGALGQLHYATITSGTEPVFGRSIGVGASGPGLALGWAVAPQGWPLRVGGRARAPARAVATRQEDDLDVRWPAQGALGVAWCTLPNAPATYGDGAAPHREGRYLLVAADLEVTGPSEGADIPALADPALPVGAATTVSVQIGTEAEVIARRLTLRAGGYNEPGRHEPARLHGTAGAAVFVGEWPRGNGIRLSAGVDLADGWSRVAVGIGAW